METNLKSQKDLLGLARFKGEGDERLDLVDLCLERAPSLHEEEARLAQRVWTRFSELAKAAGSPNPDGQVVPDGLSVHFLIKAISRMVAEELRSAEMGRDG